jgi:hypothetical protein
VYQFTEIAVLLFLSASPALAEDATAIMAQLAANVEKAVDASGQYVYQQTVRARRGQIGSSPGARNASI